MHPPICGNVSLIFRGECKENLYMKEEGCEYNKADVNIIKDVIKKMEI